MGGIQKLIKYLRPQPNYWHLAKALIQERGTVKRQSEFTAVYLVKALGLTTSDNTANAGKFIKKIFHMTWTELKLFILTEKLPDRLESRRTEFDELLRGDSASWFGDFPFVLSDYYDQTLIDKLVDKDILAESDKLISVTQSRHDKRIIWIEEKDFLHILDRHTSRFNIFFDRVDPDPHTIGNLIMLAFTKYPIVRIEEGRVKGTKVYIYQVRRPGGSGYIHAVVDRDGHIVTAYTTLRLSGSQY